jgi:hypothetical protein
MHGTLLESVRRRVLKSLSFSEGKEVVQFGEDGCGGSGGPFEGDNVFRLRGFRTLYFFVFALHEEKRRVRESRSDEHLLLFLFGKEMDILDPFEGCFDIDL